MYSRGWLWRWPRKFEYQNERSKGNVLNFGLYWHELSHTRLVAHLSWTEAKKEKEVKRVFCNKLVCPRLSLFCCDGFKSSCNSLPTSLLWWFQVILVDFAAQARHCSVCTTLCTLGYNWLSKQFVSVGTERCNTGVHGQHRYWLIARCWLVCGQWLRETYWQILTVRWINSKWYSLIDTDR